ncbi:MAG TPA: hypothetical protein VK599_08040 [Streptosporangiaceae bacterium]|nr:hypothetical protein [Streptosporangiaceae bacterium]
MASMTDQGRTNTFLNFVFGTGSIMTITAPYHLRLMSAMSATGNGNTSGANGTELTSGNSPGYTALGNTMGSSPTFATFTAGASAGNTNAVTWTATGTWTGGVAGIEVWDTTSGTPLRWLQGVLSTGISASVVVNGDTVSFASNSITVNAGAW